MLQRVADVSGTDCRVENQSPKLNVSTFPRLIIFFLLVAVSTKALAGAKTLGGFLYSAVNKAGKTVVEAGVKIKKTVEENVSNTMITLFYYLW